MIFSPLIKSKFSFEGERPYENVKILLYRHWFVLFLRLIPFAFLAVLPIILDIFLGAFIAKIGLSGLFYFIIILFYMVWWNGLFYAITMYLLDTWLVTDHRILDNEQHGFFSRTLTEASLSKIQDQSVNVRGLIPTFLDYGYLDVQTAGTIPKIEMKQIPHPNAVKTKITEIHTEFLDQHKDGIEIHERTDI